MSRRFTLHDAAERIVSRFAADCTAEQAGAAWGAAIAQACRELEACRTGEAGSAYNALIVLARNLPAGLHGTAERIALCARHPAAEGERG